MSVEGNPFQNIIQLEEITHFQKPHKVTRSILTSIHHNSKDPQSLQLDNNGNTKNKKVTYDLSPNVHNGNNSGGIFDSSDEELINDHRVPSTSSSSVLASTSSSYNSPCKSKSHASTNGFSHSGSDSSESDTEFHRRFTQLPTIGRDHDYFNRGTISDENLFPVGNAQIMQVTKMDVIFSFIVLFINVGVLSTDFTLAIWHYKDGLLWASALTSSFILLGAIGLLQQFGILQQDQLERIFRKGKRVRILVNCFPFAATIITSLEGCLTAKRSLWDPMESQQYFKINELSRSLARVQSFFQAAPQTVLQLLVLIENWHETSSDKDFWTFVNIGLSLCVMTFANLPLKSDAIEDINMEPSKAAYLPWTRMFVGLRMFSNLASRCMALTYLLLGTRCLLTLELGSKEIDQRFSSEPLNTSHPLERFPASEPHSSYTGSSPSLFLPTITGILLMIFPRIIFTLVDYISAKKTISRNLEHYRDHPESGVSSSHPISRIPLLDTFVGYLATIYFPVGDPLWLFWYLWCEAGIFIIFGNVSGVTHHCLDDRINGIYTLVFGILFIILPCLIPYFKAVVHRRKITRVRRILQVVEDPPVPVVVVTDTNEHPKTDQDDTPGHKSSNEAFSTNDVLNNRNVVVPC